jgi:hypothetical protein
MGRGMKTWIAATAVLLTLPQSVYAAKQKLLIGSFQDVVIDGDMQVIITTGKSPSGTATGDRRILELLRTDRQSEAITIRVQRPPSNDNALRVTEPLVVNLTSQNVRNITLRGNAKLRINAVTQYDGSRIYMSGGGEIIIDQMNSDRLNANLFGTSKLQIGGGKARQMHVEIEGAGTYDAANLKTRNFELIQRGNATTSAQVEEGATLFNEGAGNITITGNAECFIRKAGYAVIICPSDKKRRPR